MAVPQIQSLRFRRQIVRLVLGYLVVNVATAIAEPPEVTGISRSQTLVNLSPDSAMLRIWLIGIGQGDGILIELPSALSLTLGNSANDPVNILIDGGATPVNLAERTPLFLHRRYQDQAITIEHMVLTHHDRDHVVGLTLVLEDETIQVDHIYGSGLAAFRRGVLDIPATGNSGGFIGDKNRSLGRFDSSGKLVPQYLVDSLTTLKQRVDNNELASDYGAFAKAIASKQTPNTIQSYSQACFDCNSLDALAVAQTPTHKQFRITTIWPLKKPNRYVDWGKTTNGNSVAFRLDYGDFSMLFTGDLNENSEPDAIANLRSVGRLELLDVDILKAPHHGSLHNADEFFDPQIMNPVLTVASMGSYGFVESNYKHPNEKTILKLGGASRFYSTFIEEKEFERATMNDSDLLELVEDTHVLIETDGDVFRIVEVERTGFPVITPITQVGLTKGTRWIGAN